MAGWGVNSVVRVRLFQWDDSAKNNVMNVLHYRVHEGTISDAEQVDLPGNFDDAIWTTVRSNQGSWVSLIRVHIQKMAPTVELETEATYDIGHLQGNITSLADIEPQASACLIRKSFIPGRRGMGRFFLPGLIGEMTTAGDLTIDPTGDGDLRDVISALGQEWTTPTGKILRPCICAANGAGVTSQNDVRVQAWSKQVTYLKSRRVGVGM